ncbi:MAG: hypothetical protein Aurels2KO_37690 [Aureliella sp.]
MFKLVILSFALVQSAFCTARAEPIRVDIAIYGGTSAGVAAAVQAARMGKKVLVIEPSSHIGGLTSGGLGATDIGNKQAIGGISREFYKRIKHYYSEDSAWNHQPRDEYRSVRQSDSDDAMWTFEPHVAERVFKAMLSEHRVQVLLNARLRRDANGIEKRGATIKSICLESGETIVASRFVDCTYEGDLMALAGVSFIVGRESKELYDESLAGVQALNATKHQLQPGISPLRVPDAPSSGLLPGLSGGAGQEGPGQEGSGDHRVQAYCLRMCNTQHKPNMRPFVKPDGYDELQYELLFRNFEAGSTLTPWHPIAMPNLKTDTNNNGGFSTDFIGYSYTWAEASYQERERIYNDHLTYQQGLMWTLANHPRVPADIREYFSSWGNCRDEFSDNEGWPHQLYVREARRMVSDYVVTQHHCQGRQTAEWPVALAAYTMDSHNVRRYVDDDGYVKNEGDVQVGGFPPYPVDYRALVPEADQCNNLLVPVCLSASHMAYGSIRMEPVFMVLGQSAATAACQSIDQSTDVQSIDLKRLQRRLLDDGQRLGLTADN